MEDLLDLERDILTWLTGPGQKLPTVGDVWRGLCEKLSAGGVPLRGAVLRLAALHPKFANVFHLWVPGAPLEIWYALHDRGRLVAQEALFGGDSAPSRGGSPARAPDTADPLLPVETFGSDDAHDGQLVVPFTFTDGTVSTGRWIAGRASGFTRTEQRLIRHVAPVLSVVLELKMLRRRTGALLAAYVGEEPSKQILEGRIQRGDVTKIQAAMMLCDLRGFTELATSSSSEALVASLNRYFDAVFPHIAGSGGEVLKFMGDGILAIFPGDSDHDDAEDVCSRALDCATEIERCNHGLVDGQGRPGFRVSLALHYGEVAFGNIGSGSRLDFTVIGRDVNLVSRIEPVCKQLDEGILMSDALARRVAGKTEEVGRFALKGFDEKQVIFRPTVRIS